MPIDRSFNVPNDFKFFQRTSRAAEAFSKRIERTLQGPITPNAETVFKLRKVESNVSILALAYVSWFLSDEARCLLQLELWDKRLEPLAAQESLWLILNSKEDSNLWLSSFGRREIYGTWLPRIEKVCRLAECHRLLPSKARRLVRRRGYRDHGSIRSITTWKPSSDWSFDEEQNRKELDDDFRNLVLAAIRTNGLLALRTKKISS